MFIPELTIVIFVYNESARIERVLRNFTPFAKVLIIDNYSSDNTVEIAKRYGCEVFLNKNQGWVEDEVTVTKIKQVVKTDWIYWGYADEMIDEDVILELSSAISSNKYDVISIVRKNHYYGKFCYNAFADRLNRVFKKSAIDFTGNTIHKFGKLTVPETRVKYLPDSLFVHHFISNTAKSYMSSLDRYSDVEAKDIKSVNFTGLVMVFFKVVIKQFILGKGYKGGLPVFFYLLQMIYYRWMVGMKKYELDHDLNVANIEQLNNKSRDKVLDGLQKII